MLARLRPGFRALDEAVESVVRTCQPVLTITAAPAFASRWLVPRLSRFSAAHPNIEIRVDATTKVVDLTRSPADVAVRMGRGGWPDVHAEKLAPHDVFPVCAPAFRDRLRRPADLARVPVIHDEGTIFPWADWFRSAGIARVPTPRRADLQRPRSRPRSGPCRPGCRPCVGDDRGRRHRRRPAHPALSDHLQDPRILLAPGHSGEAAPENRASLQILARRGGGPDTAPAHLIVRLNVVARSGIDVSRCGRSQGRTAGDAPAGSRTAPVPSRSTRHALCLQCDADPMVRRDTRCLPAQSLAAPCSGSEPAS